jgi:hypothetical protein
MDCLKRTQKMFDLKIEKGLKFENEYIRISQDTMYVTKHTKASLIKKFGNKHGHIKMRSNDHRLYTITFQRLQNDNSKFVVTMSCGDYIFPNYYHNKNLTIGVLRRRWLMKRIIDMCMNTTIGRKDKLGKLLNI